MANTDSIWTEIVGEMQQEIRELRSPEEKPLVSFMHEKVKPSVVMKRTPMMTEAQRREAIDTIGGEQRLLEWIRQERSRNA